MRADLEAQPAVAGGRVLRDGAGVGDEPADADGVLRAGAQRLAMMAQPVAGPSTIQRRPKFLRL